MKQHLLDDIGQVLRKVFDGHLHEDALNEPDKFFAIALANLTNTFLPLPW